MKIIITAIVSFFLGIITDRIRLMSLDLNNLKDMTNYFLQKELVDKSDYGNRERFYNAIVKQFSGYKEQLTTFGYDNFLSEESLGKIDSILKNIEQKYNSGEGEKADKIRQYCQKERGALKELLQRDINIPLHQLLLKKIKGKINKLVSNSKKKI